MAFNGRVYTLGLGDAKVQGRATLFANEYPTFKWACWLFLWERKRDHFFVWGPFRFRYGRLKGIWVLAFGPCPFDWKAGPSGQ